jgi:hypothetical protein
MMREVLVDNLEETAECEEDEDEERPDVKENTFNNFGHPPEENTYFGHTPHISNGRDTQSQRDNPNGQERDGGGSGQEEKEADSYTTSGQHEFQSSFSADVLDQDVTGHKFQLVSGQKNNGQPSTKFLDRFLRKLLFSSSYKTIII